MNPRPDDQNPERGVTPDPHANEPAPRAEKTRPSPDADVARPDQDEELGPAVALFGAAGTEAAAFATKDPSISAAAIDMGAEAEGVESAQIFGLLLATAVALVLAVVGVFFLTGVVAGWQERDALAGMRYPELQELRTRDAGVLQQYGTTDDEGVYRIPLSRAQQLVAAEFAQAGAPAEAAPRRVDFNRAAARTVSPYRVTAPALHEPFAAFAPEAEVAVAEEEVEPGDVAEEAAEGEEGDDLTAATSGDADPQPPADN